MNTGSFENVSQRRGKSKGSERKVRKSLRPRFDGIFYAAGKLDVTPQHLRLVLLGERQSARLMAKVRVQFPGLLGGHAR